MESPQDIPLHDLSNYLGNNEEALEAGDPGNPDGHYEFSLPRADGGKDAWLFLAACFTVEALVWGMFLLPSPSI